MLTMGIVLAFCVGLTVGAGIMVIAVEPKGSKDLMCSIDYQDGWFAGYEGRVLEEKYRVGPYERDDSAKVTPRSVQ